MTKIGVKIYNNSWTLLSQLIDDKRILFMLRFSQLEQFTHTTRCCSRHIIFPMVLLKRSARWKWNDISTPTEFQSINSFFLSRTKKKLFIFRRLSLTYFPKKKVKIKIKCKKKERENLKLFAWILSAIESQRFLSINLVNVLHV